MSKNGNCELCGLPDNSYTIEDDGRVIKVCKLCYDGFIAKNGSDTLGDVDIDGLAGRIDGAQQSGAKPETLTDDEMAKLLTPSAEERRKLNAAVKRAAAAKVEQTLAADTGDLTRELLETKAEIEKEARSEKEKAEQKIEERRRAVVEKMRSAANPTIDDERIKITSPEVELHKDTRLKTNFDVATEGHVGGIRFLQAFRFVVHPVVYAVFAGLVSIATATGLMIAMSWKEAVIDFAAGVAAVVIGSLLMWYLKRRLEVDKRTLLLRIRQEEILFNSMVTPCYRELKTKYPMIKSFAWLMSRLAVIMPVTVTICGTVAAVITSFLSIWWLFGPIMLGATLASVIVYYAFKMVCDYVNFKLDTERNQQILEQSLLDLLSKKGK